MEIGTPLTLEHMAEDNQIKKYRCKIIEKNNFYLFIDYPVNEKTKKTVFFPKETHLRITYIGKDKMVYQFVSKVVTKVNLNIPALAITIPDRDKIKRIQRRNYVRVNTSIDVAVHSINHSFSPFVTVTDDISGGGMSIILPAKPELEAGSQVEVWMSLPSKSKENQYINSKAEIVYVHAKNQIHLASLKFISIDEQDQQMIIKYCFDKQRQERRKELE